MGVDINGKDREGWSALMVAAYCGHRDLVKFLLNAGAAIDDRDSYGYTALMHAVYRGHKDSVALLLERGADIHAKIDIYSKVSIEITAESI